MKRKVKKFGSGGDIITGLGAVLVGKALYDKYKEGKGESKDDDYTRRVKEFGRKGDFPEAKKEEKAAPKREEYVAADKEENNAKKEALSKGMQYKKPEGPAAVEKKIPGKKPPNKKPTVAATTANAGDSDSSSTPSSADDVISAGQKYARIGEKNKPYPSNSPAVKTAQHRQFLQKKAGLSGTGITTPGDPNKKEATSKAGVVLGGSTVRSDKEKMGERAREVQRRREEEMKSRYKKGGAVKSASARADGIAIRGKTRA